MSEEKKKTQMVTTPSATVAVPYDYGENSEKGYENTSQDDFLLPFLNLLQDTNDEIKKKDPKYIEGAVAGMFLNKATGSLYDGEKGLIIVPVITQHHYVEWIPRDQGGGFVATHGIRDEIVLEAKRANKGKITGLKTKEGNDLVDTFLIFALVMDTLDAKEASDYVVISFTATKIKPYKTITGQLRKLKGAPLFANRVLLTSFDDKNDKGHFKNVKLTPAVEGSAVKSLLQPDSLVLEQGKMLWDQVLKGMVQANFAAEKAEAGSSEDRDEVFA